MQQRIDLFRHAEDGVSFSPGVAIFSEGDPGDVMYAVQKGQVDIVHAGVTLETVGEGGIFGEMSLVDGSPRSAAAVARTDCKVVPIDRRRFEFLVQQAPYFAVTVMGIMADRLRKVTLGK